MQHGARCCSQKFCQNGKNEFMCITVKFRNMEVSIRSLRHVHIIHQFYIWQVGKNIRRKALFRTRNLKVCEGIKPWISAMINLFWWSCWPCNWDVLELKEKLICILYDINNTHCLEDHSIFRKYRRLLTKAGRGKKHVIVKLITS